MTWWLILVVFGGVFLAAGCSYFALVLAFGPDLPDIGKGP